MLSLKKLTSKVISNPRYFLIFKIHRKVIDLSKEIPRNDFPEDSFFHTYEKWLINKKQHTALPKKLSIGDDELMEAVDKLNNETKNAG